MSSADWYLIAFASYLFYFLQHKMDHKTVLTLNREKKAIISQNKTSNQVELILKEDHSVKLNRYKEDACTLKMRG